MKKSLLGILTILTTINLLGAARSPEQAAELAALFTNEQPQLRNLHKTPRAVNTLQLVYTAQKQNSDEAAFYIFNQAEDKGYILVSADDRTTDILGYCEHGHFDTEKINPNLQFWLDNYIKLISNVPAEVAYKAPSIRQAAQVAAIKPLLGNTTWAQSTPYNNMCPMDHVKKLRCLTGCVATAAAQVMRKWKWPEQGIGSFTYNWNACTTGYDSNFQCTGTPVPTPLTANFGETTYDWANMLDTYTTGNYTSTQANAVAQLMYHVGVACEMNYANVGSGAFIDYMAHGLYNWLGYTFDKFITTKSYYLEWGKWDMEPFSDVPYDVEVPMADFTNYFNIDLEAGRPIIMGGEGSNGGHAFVCDGRDANGLFHINWGWADKAPQDGYYALSALTLSGITYSSDIDAIVGLRPATEAPIPVTGIMLNPTSLLIRINEKEQLTATVTPADASRKEITWSSSNVAVAAVSTTGIVQGISEGTAIITAITKDGNKKATCSVTVNGTMEYNPTFVLLTNAEDMQAGDDIIIVSSTHNKAAGAMNSKNFLKAVDITITDNAINIPEDTKLEVFTVGGESGVWTFTTADNNTLSAVGDEKVAWNTGNKQWSVSVANNNAIIASTTDVYGRILYTVGAPRFTVKTAELTSSMVLPQIYIRKKGSIPASVTAMQTGTKTTKCLENGQLVIINNGIRYNALGQRIY